MKRYEIYSGSDDIEFKEETYGNWVNLEEVTPEDIFKMHPVCKTCSHVREEVWDDEDFKDAVIMRTCTLTKSYVYGSKHYCASHSELKNG